MARALRATPSTAGDLCGFQVFLMEQVNVLHGHHQETRTSLLSTAQAYELQFQGQDNMVSLKEIHKAVLCKVGQTSADADQLIMTTFGAEDGDILGIRTTCPSMFRYGDASMWRGTPSNDNVRKLARSMICSGFRQDSVIASRTLSLKEDGFPSVSFHLLLGDGAARGVAACIVWLLLVRHVDQIPDGEPEIGKLVRSLMRISVSFEKHGTGTPKEALLAQASRQNQAAAVLPVHTLSWITMVKSFTGLPIGNHPLTTIQLVKTIDEMVSAYNAHPEIQAYDKDIVPSRKKRKTTGGRKGIAQDEDRDIGLGIGRRRLLAMKAFLGGATDAVLHDLLTHLFIVGDYRTSVVSDDVLQFKFIYVGSRISKESLPSDAEIATRDAVGDASSKLIPQEVRKIEIRFDIPLSVEDHKLMMCKVIKVYESDIAGLDAHEAKVRCRPNEEGYLMARKIIQLWSSAIEPVAVQELTAADFAEFQRLVLTTDQVDGDIVRVLDRAPKWFHMALMPCISGSDNMEDEMSANRLTVAQSKAECALYEVFEEQLFQDWKLIILASQGQDSLKELVAWLDNKHHRQQSKMGVELVGAHCKKFFPLCEMPSWDKVSGQVSLLTQSWDKKHGGEVRAVLIMDFNIPGARDSLKLRDMIHAAANMAQNFGPGNTVLVVWMPSTSKDNGTTSPFEDEITISVALSKAGFKKQDRIVMLLDMPASQHKMVSAVDWFVSGRLCYFENDTFKSNDNFWNCNSELARTHTVRQVATLPEPNRLIETSSLEADQDLNSRTHYLEPSEKCAQRGVDVSLVQLKALLEKTELQRTTSKWLQRADHTVLVDFQPHVGDRVLATHEFRKEFDGANGELHHIIVAVGKGHQQKNACFAAERVACTAAGEWMGETLTLSGPDGHVVRPVRDALPPTEEEMAFYPGSAMAVAGIYKLEFQICAFVGNKIKIRPDKLATLAVLGAGTNIKVDQLRSKHTEVYESSFSGVGVTADTDPDENKTLADHRPVDPELDPEPGSETALITFESEMALQNSTKISANCKSTAKGVQMFRDDIKQTVYLMAIKEDMVIKAGEMLGGIGGGAIVDRDEQLVSAIPWSLPLGDKTWCQLAREKEVADEDGGKSKYWSGNLYSILRDIESKCTKPIKLTSFGEVIPISVGGKQSYKFDVVEGEENHRKLDYVITPCKAGSKVNANIFFSGLVTREGDAGAGVLRTTWRLSFDAVAHTVKPKGVHVTTTERIKLVKGQPVKVSWLRG